MAANTEYTKIKESTISAFFSKLKAAFWPKADVTNITLADVAVTGDYDDLSNKPTIPDAQIQSDWNQSDNTKKDYIKNKPTIPAAQVQSDWNESDTSSKAYIANKPTIPTVPTISTDIQADKASDAKTASPKAVYDEVHPAVASSQPQNGFLPNVEYDLGTLTGSVTFALASAVSGIGNKWSWCFKAGSTAPTITWPTGLIWPKDSPQPPNIEAGDEVEVEVKKGHIVALVFNPNAQ